VAIWPTVRAVRRHLVIGLLALMVPLVGRADDLAEARRHFRIGKAHYQQGLYDEAIAEYRAAYVRAALPDLLFDLGQAFRMKGERDQAIGYYKHFLHERPSGAASDEARRYVVELTAELSAARQREAEAAQLREAEVARLREARAARAAALAPSPPPLALAPARSTPDTPIYRRWWLWTAVGAVVAGAGVGLAVGLTRSSSPSAPSTTFGTARPF
jgi:tetratricopeptide (TPR) repeat protein